MDVSYLIQILERKVIILNNAKAQAFSVGDLDTINTVDQELLQTQNTLAQLRLLADITRAADASNTSAADVVAAAVSSTSQVSVQGPSASAIINGYDVSAYATDPLYEQKILNILASMPAFENTASLDAYIQSAASGSPVTGAMVFASAAQYNIDIPLLVAIMQNDSNFGTLGIGASTNNPGNVGNTGYATQAYPSWAEGVSAVAEWLSRHRATAHATPVATTTPTTPTPTAPAIPLSEPTAAALTAAAADTPTTPVPQVVPVATSTPIDTSTSSSTTPVDVVSATSTSATTDTTATSTATN